MTEQLALLEVEPAIRLTDRQAAVLDAVQTAGRDGIDTDHAGAILHARNGYHDIDSRCRHCGRDGRSVLRGELERKGLVRYRRGNRQTPGGWVAVAPLESEKNSESPEPSWDGKGPVPYGVIPY